MCGGGRRGREERGEEGRGQRARARVKWGKVGCFFCYTLRILQRGAPMRVYGGPSGWGRGTGGGGEVAGGEDTLFY